MCSADFDRCRAPKNAIGLHREASSYGKFSPSISRVNSLTNVFPDGAAHHVDFHFVITIRNPRGRRDPQQIEQQRRIEISLQTLKTLPVDQLDDMLKNLKIPTATCKEITQHYSSAIVKQLQS